MAIPANISTGGIAPRRYGIRYCAYPADPTFSVEVQVAPTAAFSTATNMQKMKFPPSAAAQILATFEVPFSTSLWYARSRHFKTGYTTGAWTPVVSDIPAQLVERMPIPANTATNISSLSNPQGSMLPYSSPSPGTFFSHAEEGLGVGQMWISLDWTTATIQFPDASTKTIPNPPAAPSAPSTTTVVGGALGARTRFVKIAYVKQTAFTTFETLYPVSAETTQVIAANNLLKVTSPADPGSGLYDGWAVLVGSATGVNYVQGTASIQTFGVDWTEPVGGFSTTQNSLWTATWKKLTVIGLNVSTLYKLYPYYSIAKNAVFIPAAATSGDSRLARLQNGDDSVSLGQYGSAQGFSGIVSISTPAGGGATSGNAGGGRLTGT